MTDQPRLSTHGKGTSSQQLSCHKRNMTHTHRQCTLRDDIMHLNGPINLTLMILSHSTQSWRRAMRLRGQPRPGHARTSCLLSTCSTTTQGSNLSMACKLANIGHEPASSSTHTHTRAHGVRMTGIDGSAAPLSRFDPHPHRRGGAPQPHRHR